jgi:hypothetical protein
MTSEQEIATTEMGRAAMCAAKILRDSGPSWVIQRLLSRIGARPLSIELQSFCPQEPG